MTGPGLEQSSAVGGATAAETLRRVAEEVRTAFPRPLRAPELVLIDVDPRHIHAFWTLPAATVEAARRALPRGGVEAPMVLRIHELSASGTEGAAFDVEVVGLQGRCYVDIWDEPRRYRGELGLRQADGTLVALAGSAAVELPSLGPAAEYQTALGNPTHQSERPDEQAPSPPREPVNHPFPLPPAEPSGFAPERLAAAPPPAGAAGAKPQEEMPTAERGPAAPSAEPGWGMPEPVRHPFPLPPGPSEFVPEALVGGFLPSAELGSEWPAPNLGTGAAHEEAHPEPPPAGGGSAAEALDAEGPAGPSGGGDTPTPLPLENVLTLSSWVLGRETVEFEVNAELHIFGRARSGARLQLFGRKVTLRPDGSFSITRPLPNGALVLSSLLVDSDDEGGER